MKRIALFAGLAFIVGAHAFAQDAPQNPPVATESTGDQLPNESTASHRHGTTFCHGPHRYRMHTNGGK